MGNTCLGIDDIDFINLIMQAMRSANAMGYTELAQDFLMCRNENEFRKLLRHFGDPYHNDNVLEDWFRQELSDLRLAKNIVEMMIDDSDCT